MIVLKNQLVLQFNLGQYTDFIDIKDFKGMSIIENAGGMRPVLCVSFLLQKKEIIPYLNQGNIITLRYGIEHLSNDSLQFEIQGDQKVAQYAVGSQVDLIAAMYNPAFINFADSNKLEGKSFEALQKICNLCNLKFNTNVTRSNDKQEWFQQGKTYWEFSQYITDRAFLDKSTFFTYAFDCNNMYFYDMKNHFANGAKWHLMVSNAGTSENSQVVNIGTYFPDDSMVGQMGQLAGKNVQTVAYNLDEGTIAYPKHQLKTFTTTETNSLNINASGCQSFNYMITSGKEHAFSMVALNQNKRNNILFSSFAVRVPVPGQYRDFRLLDTVQLVPAEKDNECSGLYVIAGIVRQYLDGKYSTNLTLNRESANGIKGNLVQGEK